MTGSPPPIRPEIEGLRAYPPGMPEEEVARRYGLKRIVKLASNENPLGPSPLALAALNKAAAVASWHRYPEQVGLSATVASHVGVAPEQILLGNGSDEIIILLALTFLRPGTNIVTARPEFIRYRMAAEMMGAETREAPMRDWRHDVDAMIALIDENTRAVFVASPTNPVGSMLRADEIERLAAAVPPRALFVLDQAYHEYACDRVDYPDTLGLLQRYSNLIATRTFSKAYGLAGLRIGFAMGDADLLNLVQRVRPPFNLSRPACQAAAAALDDKHHLEETMRVNRLGLRQMEKGLTALGLDDWVPSSANFVWVDVKRSAQGVFEALMRRGAIVRPMGGYGCPTHLRISIGREDENDFLLEQLPAALAEVDGVE